MTACGEYCGKRSNVVVEDVRSHLLPLYGSQDIPVNRRCSICLGISPSALYMYNYLYMCYMGQCPKSPF